MLPYSLKDRGDAEKVTSRIGNLFGIRNFTYKR